MKEKKRKFHFHLFSVFIFLFFFFLVPSVLAIEYKLENPTWTDWYGVCPGDLQEEKEFSAPDNSIITGIEIKRYYKDWGDWDTYKFRFKYADINNIKDSAWSDFIGSVKGRERQTCTFESGKLGIPSGDIVINGFSFERYRRSSYDRDLYKFQVKYIDLAQKDITEGSSTWSEECGYTEGSKEYEEVFDQDLPLIGFAFQKYREGDGDKDCYRFKFKYAKVSILIKDKPTNLKIDNYSCEDKTPDNISVDPTLTWTGIFGVHYYIVGIKKESETSFKDYGVFCVPAAGCRYDFSDLSYNTSYNVRVKGCKNSTCSDWSYCNFKTVQQGQPPVPPKPKINRVDPLKTGPGKEISIKGSNFTEEENKIRVLFGSREVIPSSATSNELKVVVPEDLPLGEYKIKVKKKANGSWVESSPYSFNFTVAPFLESLSLSEAKAGGKIIIYGKGFSSKNVDNEILFGKLTSTYPLSSSPDQLEVEIPPEDQLPPGVYDVKVRVSGIESVNSQTLTIKSASGVPPSISVTLKAEPTSGQAPLKVKLTATITVSGAVSPPYFYNFDCEDDGKYEYQETKLDENPVSYTCEFSSEGTFSPKVLVQTYGPGAEASTVVNVLSPGPGPGPGPGNVAPDCATYCSDPQRYSPPEGKFCLCNPLKAETFEELIDNLINFVFQIAVVLAPLLIIIGGLYVIFAAGDPYKVERGKKIILWTIIGFVIVLLAKAIGGIIRYLLGG